MNLKKILVLAALAAVSFGGSMVASMLWGPKPKVEVVADANTPAAQPAATITAGLVGGEGKLTPKETQLDELIREVRQKLVEVRQHEQSLEEREGRLELAQETLRKQAKDMENLRMSLLAPLQGLKEEQASLEKARLRITLEEKANLKKAASIYEKMDPSAGSKILAGMCQSQLDDAVKILHYMSERSAAKMMAEFPDKSVAAKVTERLKQIRDEG